jgi:hypothetical protein
VGTGLSGRPVSYIFGAWPAGAEQIQIETRRVNADGTEKLVARTWVDETTAFLTPITVNGKRKTEVFLRGPSQTGYKMLYNPGLHKTRWRGGNDCGIGPWSDYAFFTRTFVSKPVTRILKGPSRVKSGDDIVYKWKSNFADEVYCAVIAYGGRHVRKEYGRGAFRSGWIYEGSYTYRDRPASPSEELPNGTIYSFKVRAWCPINRRWSDWAVKPFTIARTKPRPPSLAFTQVDYGGFFNLSPRPQFTARYAKTPALWTLFDIRRLENGQARKVIRKWVSRYGSVLDGAGRRRHSSEIVLRGEKIFADLPPGTYVWRVQSYNGNDQWWDGSRRTNLTVWTDFRTNEILAAGALAQPPTNAFSLCNEKTWFPGYYYPTEEGPDHLVWSNSQSRLEGKIEWSTAPNAFVYNVEIHRSNKWFQTYRLLDPRFHPCTLNPSGRSILFKREPFPSGIYRFRVQAVNRANPSNTQYSAWSSFSPDFAVP